MFGVMSLKHMKNKTEMNTWYFNIYLIIYLRGGIPPNDYIYNVVSVTNDGSIVTIKYNLIKLNL